MSDLTKTEIERLRDVGGMNAAICLKAADSIEIQEDEIEELIAYCKDLESRLEIYERAAEVFYEIRIFNNFSKRSLKVVAFHSSAHGKPKITEGKTLEEALKKALDEAVINE